MTKRARRNVTDTVSLTISTTPHVRAHLEAIALTGFFGKNAAEVGDRLLSESIQRLLDSGRSIANSIPKDAERILEEMKES